MTVDELIKTLTQIQEKGYGKIPVAIKDYGILCKTKSCKIKVSDDTVGLYVEIEK